MEVLSKEELEQAASDFCTTHPSCQKVLLQEYKESQQVNTESNEQDQLLIEADLPEESGQDQDELMAALASNAATNVYGSADDYYEVEFVRDANQHDWSQDFKTHAMTQSDLNNLSKWLDEVKYIPAF